MRAKRQSGFSLVEMVVSVAIFVLLSASIYGIIVSILKGITALREKVAISVLANEYIEIARNLPYSKVGTLSGNPHGNLPDLPNAVSVNLNGKDYNVYYVVNFVDDPADGTIIGGNDLSPNDYKQIKFYVKNILTGITSHFLTTIAPNGLEGLGSGGALFVKVFDAVGQPVSNATIHIVNTNLVPDIDLTRMSGIDGNWVEVGLPEDANNYHIVVSKSGYSSDQTYQPTAQNPNPIKPDSTVLNGQITQISFAIDFLSDLVIRTLDGSCGPIPGINLALRGSNLIGIPDVLKFDNNYISTDEGEIIQNNIEWDNYIPMLNEPDYMIYGSSPVQQISILPNTNQIFTLTLGPKTANSLLVIVKDAANGNSIEGASVELQKISPPESTFKITGGSVLSQDDWTGGAGQAIFVDSTKYFDDDGHIDGDVIPSGLRLSDSGGNYYSDGVLTSSTFDTGTDQTVYTTLSWQPTSQDPETNVKFQVATNNDNENWNYIGPDGTGGSYFTTPGATIYSGNNNNRYVRYKIFLSTANPATTPVITSVGINYVSGCFSPGQAFFPGLTAGEDYNVVVSLDGYQTETVSGIVIGGYNLLNVSLAK